MRVAPALRGEVPGGVSGHCAQSWKNIGECVNRCQDAERRLPRDTTPIQVRGTLNAERRQHDNGVWPPWPSVQPTNEQCRGEDLNGLRSMKSSHQFDHAD